jgi:hypothetical protein
MISVNLYSNVCNPGNGNYTKQLKNQCHPNIFPPTNVVLENTQKKLHNCNKYTLIKTNQARDYFNWITSKFKRADSRIQWVRSHSVKIQQLQGNNKMNIFCLLLNKYKATSCLCYHLA